MILRQLVVLAARAYWDFCDWCWGVGNRRNSDRNSEKFHCRYFNVMIKAPRFRFSAGSLSNRKLLVDLSVNTNELKLKSRFQTLDKRNRSERLAGIRYGQQHAIRWISFKDKYLIDKLPELPIRENYRKRFPRLCLGWRAQQKLQEGLSQSTLRNAHTSRDFWEDCRLQLTSLHPFKRWNVRQWISSKNTRRRNILRVTQVISTP